MQREHSQSFGAMCRIVLFAQVKKELSEETSRVDFTAKRLDETREFDHQQRGKLKEVNEKSKVLEMQINEKENADQALRSKLNETQTSVDILRSDLREASRHKTELQQMLAKTMREGEQMTEIMAEKSTHWQTSREAFNNKIAELKSAVDTLTYTHDRLLNALKLKQAENENLGMLEAQTREDRTKELMQLKTKIDEMTGVTGELHKRLTSNYESIRMKRRHLDDIEPETMNLGSMLKEKSTYLQGITQQFNQQHAALDAAISLKEGVIERCTAEGDAMVQRIRGLNNKAFKLAGINEKLRQSVMAQELKAHEARDKYIEAKKLEVETEGRLKSLEDECTRVEQRLNACTRDCTLLSEHLMEAESEKELTTRKLSDQAMSKAEVQRDMQRSTEALHQLERQLKMKDGTFKIDSITVAAKIRELQSSLVEKVEGAERLTGQLQSVEQNNDALRAQLMELHEDMEEKKTEGEAQLERWRQKVSQMFQDLGQKKVQEVSLQTQLGRKKEEASEVTLHFKLMEDSRTIAVNELEMTRDKVQYLQVKLDQHNAKIAETNNTLDARDTVVAMLKKQLEAKEQVGHLPDA